MQHWNVITEENTEAIRLGAAEIMSLFSREYDGEAEQTEEAGVYHEVRIACDPALKDGAYRLQVYNDEKGLTQVRITGQDDISAMYGCMDFAHVYLPQNLQSRTTMSPYYFHPLSDLRTLPETDLLRVPQVKKRGLWTWGTKVYDWRGYLRNMARLKLNEVIFWNDFAPLNGSEIVSYAHALGIRVLWGYPWGWDTSMVLDDSEEAVTRIVRKYEEEYAPLSGDGIYFQTFTETKEERLNGRLIAEAAVDFVNRIAARILSAHPGLRLQFGLHATSVKDHLEYISRTDGRVEIIWEDCGDFPYAYIPGAAEQAEKTAAFSEKMLTLRENGGAGAVLKGMVCLNWEKFTHQTSPERMGEKTEAEIAARLPEAQRIRRFVQAEWMVYGDTAQETIRQLSRGDVSLYALLEDGLFEREIPLYAALFAELLWDSERPYGELLRETAERPDITLA